MRIRLLSALLFASLAGAGCAGSGQVHYGASVTTPDLVYVSPGVQVIADYDEPVFYSDNYYWRYDAGVWYRSPYHTRGWVRVYDVPTRIRQIDRPTAYIHYRSNNRTVVRDNRDYRQPTPVVRDTRDEERRRQIEREQQERQRQEERRLQTERREDQRQEQRQEQTERREDQRQDQRQDLTERREREREIERQKLIQQREREQREKERERARGR